MNTMRICTETQVDRGKKFPCHTRELNWHLYSAWLHRMILNQLSSPAMGRFTRQETHHKTELSACKHSSPNSPIPGFFGCFSAGGWGGVGGSGGGEWEGLFL